MSQTAIREVPRISLNALAEYLTSTAGRRRAIVVEQKRPKTFQVAYYSIAERAIATCWIGGLDEAPLDRVIDRLRLSPARKRWDTARAESTIGAIESFRSMSRQGAIPRLEGLRAVPKQHQAFGVAGVSVSIRPELLFSDSDTTLGGVKLYLSKRTPLSGDRANYSGALLRMYFESERGMTTASHDSFVLDVFAQTLHSSPGSFRRRRKDIEAACSEIASIWEDL